MLMAPVNHRKAAMTGDGKAGASMAVRWAEVVRDARAFSARLENAAIREQLLETVAIFERAITTREAALQVMHVCLRRRLCALPHIRK
jgi:hypothetical protein